jgi:hypothetical protein
MIRECDSCGERRPGLPGIAYGIEGFFCHICRCGQLDPYGELEEVDPGRRGRSGGLALSG